MYLKNKNVSHNIIKHMINFVVKSKFYMHFFFKLGFSCNLKIFLHISPTLKF